MVHYHTHLDEVALLRSNTAPNNRDAGRQQARPDPPVGRRMFTIPDAANGRIRPDACGSKRGHTVRDSVAAMENKPLG